VPHAPTIILFLPIPAMSWTAAPSDDSFPAMSWTAAPSDDSFPALSRTAAPSDDSLPAMSAAVLGKNVCPHETYASAPKSVAFLSLNNTDTAVLGNVSPATHQLLLQLLETIRSTVEDCDSLQSFLLLHSLGGGTGSGVGTYILELLAVCSGAECGVVQFLPWMRCLSCY